MLVCDTVVCVKFCVTMLCRAELRVTMLAMLCVTRLAYNQILCVTELRVIMFAPGRVGIWHRYV